MNGIERANVIGYLGARYRRSAKAGKGEILRELEERLGIGRRQARRLLSPGEPGRPKKPDMRGRPSKYGDVEFRRALKGMWRTTCKFRFQCPGDSENQCPGKSIVKGEQDQTKKERNYRSEATPGVSCI